MIPLADIVAIGLARSEQHLLGIELLRLVRLGTRGLEEFESVLLTLECADLPPAEALRQQLLAELEAAWRGPRA